MRQNEISPALGSRHIRKRVGRGNGSGHGTYAGRGRKGQKARAGNRKMRPGFEGGQLPIIKRLPQKRGFTNHFRVEYTVVDVGQLNVFEAGSEVTSEMMLASGLIKSLKQPIKVLADGELDRSLTIKAHKFSNAAKTKIEAAGGKAEEVSNAVPAE